MPISSRNILDDGTIFYLKLHIYNTISMYIECLFFCYENLQF